MRCKSKLIFILVFLLAPFSTPSLLYAGQPTEEIRSAINQGIEIVKGAKLDNKAEKTDIISRLREIVYPLFDFDEMARRSLGSHWRRLNPQQQGEFVTTFTELLEKTYADKIDLYEGQKVSFTGESLDKDFAQVDTRVIGKQQSYSVDYRLHLVNGKWKIYDVIAENISLVNNYRSQFNRVLANSSFQELLKIMKEKG
jgi:phospholipid transport system substrate-binding protein